MNATPRSQCAINRPLEIFGDRWTLLILRDMILGGRRRFRELLVSEEGIASNILASRLKMLVAEGMLTRRQDPGHKQKAIYSLTEKSIALFPILAHIGLWGRSHLEQADLFPETAALLEGRPEDWDAYMAKLRSEHIKPQHIAKTQATSPLAA